MHYIHVKRKKQQLRQYGIDSFASCHARNITTGVELPKNLINVLIDANYIRDKAYNVFVQKRLAEEEKVFLIQLRKFNYLPSGLKSKKAKPEALSAVKDRQAFGVILGMNTDLLEALKYPITTVPLSIANLHHVLRRGLKNDLRNFIVNESEAIKVALPRDSRWIFGTISIKRSLKAKKNLPKMA